MKFLFSILFVLILIISGCSNVDDEIKTEQKTIEQASLESDIPSANIFYTEEIGTQEAFSLFQSPNGCGVMNFSKSKNGWVYQGYSSFQYDIEDISSFTLSQSSWHKGEISLNKESYYSTVFLGEIIDPEIDKIIVEYDNMNGEANIVENNGRRFWYLLSEPDKGYDSVNTISAYSSDGKLLYIEEG
ncbi:hypothetical protein [Bacillus marasmi]|uniref:hypothetical protein n=1 Tax=Bacillus marasmi TaxID=1926279 RepID=UPI0011C853E9|nr:hypothetical protein [Bacillus marasmi]